MGLHDSLLIVDPRGQQHAVSLGDVVRNKDGELAEMVVKYFLEQKFFSPIKIMSHLISSKLFLEIVSEIREESKTSSDFRRCMEYLREITRNRKLSIGELDEIIKAHSILLIEDIIYIFETEELSSRTKKLLREFIRNSHRIRPSEKYELLRALEEK